MLAAEEHGRLLGFVITKVSAGRGYIADLLAVPGRADVVLDLLSAAVEGLRAAPAYGVDFWLPRRHPYQGALRRLGFFATSRETGISFRIPGDEGDLHYRYGYLDDPFAGVHPTMLDSDLI